MARWPATVRRLTDSKLTVAPGISREHLSAPGQRAWHRSLSTSSGRAAVGHSKKLVEVGLTLANSAGLTTRCCDAPLSRQKHTGGTRGSSRRSRRCRSSSSSGSSKEHDVLLLGASSLRYSLASKDRLPQTDILVVRRWHVQQSLTFLFNDEKVLLKIIIVIIVIW